MTDFQVVPDALRRNVRFLYDAGDCWDAARKALDGEQLGDDALGELGQAHEVVREHNETLEAVLGTLREGVEVLERAGDSLNGVARTYEDKDAEYYEKFGYLG